MVLGWDGSLLSLAVYWLEHLPPASTALRRYPLILPLLQTWGSAAAWLFTLHFILTISIPASMILFWHQSRYAPWLAYAQTPLRLAFMLPSLSLVVWLAQAVALKSAAFFIALLLVSEAAKVVTLWRCRKV
ncbi:arginine/ornithine antiporter [Klebsiella michiganensis]|nr:arginine/ornithine antiporter [Klebsiella michiganensis]